MMRLFFSVFEVLPEDAEVHNLTCQLCVQPRPAVFSVDSMFPEPEHRYVDAGIPTFACAAHIGDLIGNLIKADSRLR